MIKLESLKKEYIEEQSGRLKVRNIDVLERTIHAFILLERLAGSGIDFVFKGGTSLLLHIEEPQRLSVDIDITCSVDKTIFENILRQICTAPFERFEPSERGADRRPRRRHYKFYYTGICTSLPVQPYVLLDVVEEKNEIIHIEKKPVLTSFLLNHNDPLLVNTPTIDALLGDKLTAYAPATTGVSLEEDCVQQFTKQLFDIGYLFRYMTDFEVVKKTYLSVGAAEMRYRGKTDPLSFAMHDTFQTSFDLCCLDLVTDKHKNTGRGRLMRRGIEILSTNLINNRKFRLPEAKIAAARAAHLIAIILENQVDVACDSIKYRETEDVVNELKSARLSVNLGALGKLRSVTEAYWHWYQIGKKSNWKPS
jgi:hypothetical protein